ncbi:MAG: hypothetical protein EXR50_01755 [Dehalococcoidia bacterium]|nr:hypothetical protein [Dehalococcoidia bacterium]
MPPAKTLRDAFNALRPDEPISPEDPEGFYVPRPPGQGIDNLKAWLEADDAPFSKLLFSGHRGGGKTTELSRLAHELEASYFVVRYSIDMVRDITDIDLLLSMASQLINTATEHAISAQDTLVDNLLHWSAGTVIEPKLTDLIEHLDSLLDDISTRSDSDVLFIIDGIDKVTPRAFQDLFVHTTTLLLPQGKVVYTMPYDFQFAQEVREVGGAFSAAPFTLPNIQVHARDGSAYKPGQDYLAEVLLKRIDAMLLSSGTKEKLVAFSGGVVRELICLARDACLRASLDSPGVSVAERHVLAAASEVQNAFSATLTLDDYRELATVARDNNRLFTPSPAKERLTRNQSLLLYLDEHNRVWCDVHPLVLPLLEQRLELVNP